MSRENPDRDAALGQLVSATVEEIEMDVLDAQGDVQAAIRDGDALPVEEIGDFLHELNEGSMRMGSVLKAAGYYENAASGREANAEGGSEHATPTPRAGGTRPEEPTTEETEQCGDHRAYRKQFARELRGDIDGLDEACDYLALQVAEGDVTEEAFIEAREELARVEELLNVIGNGEFEDPEE